MTINSVLKECSMLLAIEQGFNTFVQGDWPSLVPPCMDKATTDADKGGAEERILPLTTSLKEALWDVRDPSSRSEPIPYRMSKSEV